MMSENKAKLVSPQTLMAIKNLELRARVVVEGFWHGFHRSPYHGFSVEFTEYRQYSPGDDPRYLDWRLFARTDRYFIKKFEDETNLRCHLLVDNSRSMTYGSVGYTKAQYANTLAATLAFFLHQQGDAVGLLTFDEEIREFLPARHRIGHLRHLMLKLERPAGGKATDLAAPLRYGPRAGTGVVRFSARADAAREESGQGPAPRLIRCPKSSGCPASWLAEHPCSAKRLPMALQGPSVRADSTDRRNRSAGNHV